MLSSMHYVTKNHVKKGIKANRYKATLQPSYAQKVLNSIF
ncbi:hypothetical protein LDG_5852 [Legionella drancourtii LLAP12]|uniref:Uncharacterized protein n=1 Tax=Legionella drancourtii LLAP12 TaxID=658187 RepID=G9EKV8_9GAMM|nr:hypothetical protein LDG_5852 [Legionella drancourtii LLAP12]